MAAEIKITKRTKETLQNINNEVAQRMLKAVIFMHNEVKETLTGTRSGRRYKINKTSTGKQRKKPIYHIASAPGEPPAVLFGRLRNSIKFEVRKKGNASVEGIVGSKLDKAVWLEQGTQRIKPRPFLEPTFKKNQDKLKTIFSEKMNP